MTTVFCRGCGTTIHESAPTCPKCGAIQKNINNKSRESGNERVIAALLAFFLGGIGLHKFYTGRVAAGILYILFCWTFIPMVISFVEGIYYLTMTNEQFTNKFNK